MYRRTIVSEKDDSLLKDYRILSTCGNLDSIDLKLLDAEYFLTLALSPETDIEQMKTYDELIQTIHRFQQTTEYPKFREQVMLDDWLKTTVVKQKNWEIDRQMLARNGLTDQEVEAVHSEVVKNTDRKLTYQRLLDRMKNEPIAKEKIVQESAETHLLGHQNSIVFTPLWNVKAAKEEGEKMQKPVLIYFTASASANARRMEEQILLDEQVTNLINQNYLCFIAYLDDKTFSAHSEVSTGEKNATLQIEEFEAFDHPHFYLLDTDGNLVDDQRYTHLVVDFISFLMKGLE